MKVTKTLWQWYELFNLPPETHFTDSQGVDFWAIGEGHITDSARRPVEYSAIELPVTYETESHHARLRVVKIEGFRWIAVGHGVYKSFSTHHEAIHWAQKRVRQ